MCYLSAMKNSTEMQILDACIALRKVRQDNNLSLEIVEGLADIPKAAISKYERGLKIPKVTTLSRWANVLGCKVDITLRFD